jgi:prepilin-type N-terminal cleavage/methylation domain-containing protein
MLSAKSRSARRRHQRGFTLIEALATASVLGIGLLGLSASSILITRIAKSADMTGAATALATQQIELLRSMPLNAPGLNPGSYNGGTFSPSGSAGGPISLTWVVSAKDTPSFGLKTATVTATWTDSRTHTVTLPAYIRCATVPC